MNSPLIKFVCVACLSAFLVLPLLLIQNQIVQRSRYQKVVEEEIAYSAAGAQTLIAPMLRIRYRVEIPPGRQIDPETGKEILLYAPQVREGTRLLPVDTLEISGETQVQARYRGIYRAQLYHAQLNLAGRFTLPADLLGGDTGAEHETRKVHAALIMGISDLHGLDGDPEVKIGTRVFHFEARPNASDPDSLQKNPPQKQASAEDCPGDFPLGICLEADLGEIALGPTEQIRFDFPVHLTGTKSLSILPTARETRLKLASSWRHPSFQGTLPRERTLDKTGFKASWQVFGIRGALFGKNRRPQDLIRIDFVDPVNIYLQSERAVKYGILFVALTFIAFFLGEILRQRAMHIVQYLLVGLALTIFFLLLIALSEHIAFLYAYLVSAFACIGLITFYLGGVLASWRPAFSSGAGLVGLYGVLYGVLQSEDNALLMGALLLFIALAAIMVGTRRLDWETLVPSTRETRAAHRRPDEIRMPRGFGG